MFSICSAVWPVLFLTMSCRLLFHNLAFLAPVAKQTVVQRMWVRCKQRNKTQSWREKARHISWNDPLRFLHMIPVINEQGHSDWVQLKKKGTVLCTSKLKLIDTTLHLCLCTFLKKCAALPHGVVGQLAKILYGVKSHESVCAYF